MELRELIYLIEQGGAGTDVSVSEPEAEWAEESVDVAERLNDLIFKMRAYSEPLNESVQGGYCLGVEAGLEMAAEMLENLLREMGE